MNPINKISTAHKKLTQVETLREKMRRSLNGESGGFRAGMTRKKREDELTAFNQMERLYD